MKDSDIIKMRGGNSWMIVDKVTRNAVAEVYDKRKLKYLNTEKYEALNSLQYLQEFNSKQKAAP